MYNLLWKTFRQELIDSPLSMRMVDLMNKYVGEFPMHSGYIPENDTTLVRLQVAVSLQTVAWDGPVHLRDGKTGHCDAYIKSNPLCSPT